MIEIITKNLIKKVISRVAPPEELTISEWADNNRVLSPEAAAEAGKWNTDRAPFQRGIMDAISDDDIPEIVGQLCSQVGKTEILLNTLGYYIEQDPSPILFLQPTIEMAESFSKERVSTMIRDTAILDELVSDVKSKTSSNTIRQKQFPGGVVNLAGANSPASLASRPVRILLMDEVDRYPISAGTEGDPVFLAKKRTKTFSHNKKIIQFSTPTIKNHSKIERAYNESDRRKYFFPCPSCGEFQTFAFSQIEWKDNDPDTAIYICPFCKKEIPEEQKLELLSLGEWRATAPFRGVAGFYLNEIYSPWVSFSEIVDDFLKAKNDPEMLKTWINTSMGETYEEKGDSPQWEIIYQRREDYKIGEIPNGPVILTAGVDVQKDRLELEIVGWGRDSESWSIEYLVLMGDTDEEQVWEELEEVLYRTWNHVSGVELPLSLMCVDSGYRTDQVYSFCRKHNKRARAIKGDDNLAIAFSIPKKVDLNKKGKKVYRGLQLWKVGSSYLKSELYGKLKQLRPTDEAIKEKGFPRGYCHFPMYGEEFFKQLTAEKLIYRRSKNRASKREWIKMRPRNEALDCRVYARAAAIMLGVDKWKEAKWQKLELQVPTRGHVSSANKTESKDINKMKKKKSPKWHDSGWL